MNQSDTKLVHRFWFPNEQAAIQVVDALNDAAVACRDERKSRRAKTGSLDDVTRVTGEGIARIDVAVSDEVVQKRLPGLKCTGSVGETTRVYQSSAIPWGVPVLGESVAVRCAQNDRLLASASWATQFPFRTSLLTANSFLGASIAIEDVLGPLVGKGDFQLEDLAHLAASPIPEVRIAAVVNLNDQNLLARLTDDRVVNVRQAALDKLSDQTLLAKIAGGPAPSIVRLGAVRKLSDQKLLARLSTQDSDPDIRKAALRNLTDQTVLLAVVNTEKDWSVRNAALSNITDQDLLAHVATTDSDGVVRQSAVKAIHDPAILAKLATTSSEPRTRGAATEKLKDQAVLAKIVTDDADWSVRLAAINNLTDREVLAKVAENDRESRVRLAAQKRLDSTR
jgi:hypothetical protein